MNIVRTQAQKDFSLETLGTCLRLLQQASSDNDTFSALLLITNHVRTQIFTPEDQKTVLEVAGLEFVSRLLSSQSLPPHCPPDYYKCVGLSILSAWTVEPVIAQHPAMTDVLAVINEVLSPGSLFKAQTDSDSQAIYQQMCRDSEEIVFNLAKHETSMDRLLQADTPRLLLEYLHSPSCQDVSQVLESLSTVVMSRGDSCLNFDPDKLLDVIKLTVRKLDQNPDVKEKARCARILASFLSGLSTVEVTVQMDWVRELVLVLRKLISAKLSPVDSQAVLGLVCALVSAAGPQSLSPEVSGDAQFLKAVVARVSVEVYMQLDYISVHNASQRYPFLDRVYKLLSSVVQFLAESGEGIDSSSIIVIYKKLVEISETIMMFLLSVARQDIQFPRNHILVLKSVRTLAAMLAEITEDVTPTLLELLPFFNLLCRNDLVVDITNTAPPALAIKCMEIEEIAESEENRFAAELSSDHDKMDVSSNESLEVASSTVENSNHTDLGQYTLEGFGHLNVADPDACKAEKSTFRTPSSTPQPPSSLTAADHLHTQQQQDNDTVNKNISHDTENQISQNCDISLSGKSIEDFKAYQALVYSLKTKAQAASPREVLSFLEVTHLVDDQVVPEQWKPTPDDVLGYVLPIYMCILDNSEVVEVMCGCGTFETIITFLKTSLSRLLDKESSGYPESSTINAFSVIELMYTNFPVAVANQNCFNEFFETSLMTLPQLLTQPSPPTLVCLKLLEVSLVAYRIQMRDDKGTRSSPQLKQSQLLLFRAAVEYLSSFYEIRQHMNRQLLRIRKEVRVIWPLAEESWSGCIAGLCTLVRSVEELQDSLATSQMLPEFLSFLATFDGLSESSKAVQELIKSMFSLIESAAEGSAVLCKLIQVNHGQIIAKKFQLKKLEGCLQRLSEQSE